MTHRQRFRAVLNGQIPDRVPVVCRLDLWHRARQLAGDLPDDLRDQSLEQIQLGLGMAVSARRGRVFKQRLLPPVDYRCEQRGLELLEWWRTPRGELHRRTEWCAEDAALKMQGRISEYPICKPEHYAIYEEIVRHIAYEPDYDAYREYDQQVGEQGLPMVILGPCPAHDLMLNWVGYESAFYDLADIPHLVEQAIEAGNAAYRRMWPIVAGSPCELVMHGVNFDSGTTSPPIFRRHFLPYLQAFNQAMHEAGKRVAFHGDGDQSLLLDLVLEAGYDVADCLAVAPMGSLAIERAAQAWRGRIVIWGGVPSTLLEPSVDEEALEAHLAQVARSAGDGAGLILGIADQAMPGTLWPRLQRLGRFELGPFR